MNRFVCCGVVTAIKDETRTRALYKVRDEYRTTGKIGIETYYIHAEKNEDIQIGDVIFAVGTFGDKVILEAEYIDRIGVLLVNNLMCKLADEVNTAEEIIKDVAISDEW